MTLYEKIKTLYPDIVTDDNGKPYSECRYYAENPEEAPSELRGINSEFSCACDWDRCLQLKDNCCHNK